MPYLTTQHTRPPGHIIAGGKRIPLAPLIARQDTERLAQYGIYPHETAPGDAPLGYTDWELEGDGWCRRWPAGTKQERQAALDAQAAAAHEAYLDSLECEPLQAELELIDRGLWSTVSLWIDQQDAVTQAYFRRAKRWRYRDERLQSGAAAMGLSDAVLIEILESARLR
ncbi:MAG: hypothetical protein EOM24_22055 [Chloroflexia bacterium]|nr:hypothetical protein [Chloroflexia bacterium]